MKRKIRLVLKGVITLLVLILGAYYAGFLGERPVRLDIYTKEEHHEVYKCLAGIKSPTSERAGKGCRDSLYVISFNHNQNILHYAFNRGDPELLDVLTERSADTLKLFDEKDSKGNKAIDYYRRYCKFTNLKPQPEEILKENPMSAVAHIVDYFYESDPLGQEKVGSNPNDLTQAIEKGKLEQVKEIVFSPHGNNDKSRWANALKALASLRSNVAKKDEIESLLKPLKEGRKEDANFWKRVRKVLSSAPNVYAMTNYLHKLVATSPQKKPSLLYYITHIGGLRGYQIYKHIEYQHSESKKSTFSALFLAANDPHHPIKLNLADQDEYQERLAKEITNLKSYMHIDADKFAKVNPKDRSIVRHAKFEYERNFVHACVLKEAPEQLEICCKKYFDKLQQKEYKNYWKKRDNFGLTPDDYLKLVKDRAKAQDLQFLQHFILTPTEAEMDVLSSYKTKLQELKLGDVEGEFNRLPQKAVGLVFTRQKDKQRNMCHIAARSGAIGAIKILSANHPYFKELCVQKDSWGKTPADYAQQWLDEDKKEEMLLYLTTQFDIKGEKITQEAVQKAITESNWQQIRKWEREEPTAFGGIWAKHRIELLKIAEDKEKPTTYSATSNLFKTLKLLSQYEFPTKKMVANSQSLLPKDKNDATCEQLQSMQEKIKLTAAGNKKTAKAEDPANPADQKKELDGIADILDIKLFIPDHKNHNKTILHTCLPKLVAEATADQLERILKSKEKSLQIALCLVDDKGKTPLDLIKKALKDKNQNAKEVQKKLNIIKQFEEDELATYQSEYTWHTRETATSLYKKDNILGLEAYLKRPASYMSPKLLETMIQDGAYDVVEKVCDTKNLYVISAAKALTATPKKGEQSPLTTLSADKKIKKAIKCRYLLKEGRFIQKVATDKMKRTQLKQLERMWKVYPMYCAIMANKYWNDQSASNNDQGDNAAHQKNDVLHTLYEQYRFLSTNAQKKRYGFNNAHIAVINNDLQLLEKYERDTPLQLESWLNQTDRMGRTPLYYINYRAKENQTTERPKRDLFNLMHKYVKDLDATQILKSPAAARILSNIKERPFQHESYWFTKITFLSPGGMLEQLAVKEKAKRNPLHYACLGMDSDIEFLHNLLKEGRYDTKKKVYRHYTKEEIQQEDINGCRPIDYVPEDHKSKFQSLLTIYETLAESNTLDQEKLVSLVEAAKAYRPKHKKELPHPIRAVAKKFSRKGWFRNFFEKDSWYSLFAVELVDQANYLPELYTQLLEDPAMAIAVINLYRDNITLKTMINLNEQDREGKTWLLKAIEKEQWGIAKALLEADADWTLKDIYDTDVQFLTTVLDEHSHNTTEAYSNGKQQILSYIKEQLDISKANFVIRKFKNAGPCMTRTYRQICYVPKKDVSKDQKST